MYQFYRKKGSKYNAQKCEYNGKKYPSVKEMRYAMKLDLRKKAHDIKDWEGQVKIPLIVNNIKICTYICDFEVTYNDNTKELIETKGYETDVYKLKLKLFKALYPNRKHTQL